MKCKYNNSLYCPIPPSIIILEPSTPQDELDWIIRTKLDEENYENSYEDIEAVRVRELINGDSYGENEGTKT